MNLKCYDILQNEEGQIVTVIKYTKKGLEVWNNSEKIKLIIPFEELNSWKIANPIVDNRFVYDYTFAVRFKQFLNWIPKDWYMSEPHYYEEYKYMQIVADRLLKYQIETATDVKEIDYFERLDLYDNGN